MCLFKIIHSRACTGICFPHTRTMSSFDRFTLSLALAAVGELLTGPACSALCVPLGGFAGTSPSSVVQIFYSRPLGPVLLGGTESRALEEGVCCSWEETAQEKCLGCCWPGFAVGEMHRLTSKLVPEISNQNSGCCTTGRGSGLSLSADLTSCPSKK